MNRSNFLARLAAQDRPNSASSKHRATHHVGLEPLEDRKMLAASPVYINDNWTNLDGPTLEIGDFIESAAADGQIVTAEYGFDGFGTVGGSSIPGAALIDDAILNTNPGGTLNILAGTYRESDIVVDKPITIRGVTGPNPSLIVPEVVSSQLSAQNFAVGTHSGFIIYSPSVTIEQVTIDGNGNGSLAGTLNFHHGITTLFDTQNGGNYLTTRGDSLAPSNMGAANAETLITIQNVTVTNTWWHGITLSGVSGTNIARNSIFNSTVSNIGQAGSRDLDRIGILMQNHSGGQVIGSTVSNAGVGIATGVFGPNSFGSNAQARNASGVRLNTVTNADQRAYSMEFLDEAIDLEFLILEGAEFAGFNANKAIYTNPANNAVGLYIYHSQTVVIGYESTNAKIGVLVENTTIEDLLAPVFAATTITGPGIGVAGSVGILADNAGDTTSASTFGIAGSTKITGYQTGIRIHQSTPIVEQNYTQIDRPLLSGNGTAVSVGNNSVFQGNVNTGDAVVTTGTGTISPGFPDSFFMAKAPGDFAGPYADVAGTGNVTFNSSSTFDALLAGQTGSTPLFTFNEELGAFPLGFIPPVPDGGRTQEPLGSNYGDGNLVQTGGQMKLQGSAANGPLSLGYATLSHPDPNEPGYFVFDPADISAYSHLNIVVKLGAGNQAKGFIFGLVDYTGQIALFTFPTEGLNSTTYTTISLNLAAPGVPLALGDNANFDLTKVTGWALLGDLGLLNGAVNIPLRLTFEEVVATNVLNAQLNVTGSVTLGGSNLKPTIAPGFTPSMSQSFTIINNDGADAVIGTFNGIANNTVKSINGHNWHVTYTGGTGNDVVIQYRGVTPTGSTIVDRHIFYNQSSFDGNSALINPVNDNNAIAPDKDAYLPLATTAVYTNITNFSRGINGIMVDLSPGGNHAAITASDFTFKVGNNNTPGSWAAAPAPSAVSVVPGGGVGGNDRVIITWATGTIRNTWLEVQVKANANTGLIAQDVHFWGNKIGDTGTGTPAGLFQTTTTDSAQVNALLGPGKPITDLRDFNRDGQTTTTDAAIVAANLGTIVRLNVGPGGPFAPEATPATDDGGSAVASALAARSSGAPQVPGWISSRLASVDLNNGPIARLFTQLAEADTPRTKALLIAANEITDSLDLDDSLLESLIAGLN